MEKKRIMFWAFIVIISIVLIGFVLRGIFTYSPRYTNTVIDYSDKAPRVGNNIYGYIDVPEGFVMAGSFNEQNDDYAGGKDGIKEGVRLYAPDGSACITISLMTPDENQEDYIGMGFQKYVTCTKKVKSKNDKLKAVSYGVLEELTSSNELMARTDVDGDDNSMSGVLIESNGLSGEAWQWDSMENGQSYHNQMNILEDPEKKNTLHCVTLTYKSGAVDYIDNLYTFSLNKEKQDGIQIADSQYMGDGKRAGEDSTGYINIPENFKECQGFFLEKWVDNQKKDSSMSFFVDKDKLEGEVYPDETMVVGSFTKSAEFDSNVLSYMDRNFSEVFGLFNVREYFDLSNVSLSRENSEFGAKAFVSVMEQCLRKEGEFTYTPAMLDGKQGYKVEWSGRDCYNNKRTYFSFYLLDSADGNTVYIAGAREKDDEGKFWKYLNGFSEELSTSNKK